MRGVSQIGPADPNRRGVSVRFNALPDNSTEIRTTRGAIVSPGEVITPDLYVRCFRLCRDAIGEHETQDSQKRQRGKDSHWFHWNVLSVDPCMVNERYLAVVPFYG